MKAPAFTFYVRDWMCSRKVTAMTGDQVKAYMYLLCEAWLEEPRATLPMDDKELALMARVSLEKWNNIKDGILCCFYKGTCKEHKGRFYNELLLHVSRKSQNKQRLNNKNAKRTQIKRKLNATEIEDEIETKEVYNNVSPLESAFNEFVEMRKKIKKPMTKNAMELAKKKLKEMSGNNDEIAIKIIEQSIMGSWQGLFPLKDNNKQRKLDGYEIGAASKYDNL